MHRDLLVKLAAQHNFYYERLYVTAGGLISYWV
jgi:hypothetical protein